MMIGYHYTSWENWQTIQVEGLHPYPMNHKTFQKQGVKPVGIWTWIHRQRGVEHVGSIIFQVGAKASTRIVELQYPYEEADLWVSERGDRVSRCVHTGFLSGSSDDKQKGKLLYHDRIPSVIIGKPIPPEKIQLIGDFDLVHLFGRL